MNKKKLGMFLRADLETLLKDEQARGAYDFFGRLANEWGSYHLLSENSNISDMDLVLFFHYPYDEDLAKKLVKFEQKTPFINKPSGVLKTSEKTFELNEFSNLSPSTLLISKDSSYKKLNDFVNNFESVVVKPVDGTGGRGIYFLEKPYLEQDVVKLEAFGAEKDGRYLVQEALKNDGSTRILCYNGILLGGYKIFNLNKIHNSEGCKFINFNPSDVELNVAEEVSHRLIEHGIYYAGVDLINDKLIEVNTAMPGGLGTLTPHYNFKDKNEVYKAFKEETKKILKDFK